MLFPVQAQTQIFCKEPVQDVIKNTKGGLEQKQ